MSFTADTEDDEFSSLNTSSKLATLFRDSLNLHPDNKALTYTAPKRSESDQQQPVKQRSHPVGKQEVLIATAVTCYKLNNDKYEVLQGKVGLALLGNHENHLYSIVLYLNKQKPLSTVQITKDFKISSQPDNFCSYYDDLRQNWAILFDTYDIAEKFMFELEKVLTTLGGGRAPQTEFTRETNNTTRNKPEIAEDNSKTKLISRMAKLGQPILPLKGAIVAEDSDLDTVPTSSTDPEDESKLNQIPQQDEQLPFKPAAQGQNESTFLNSAVLSSHPYSQQYPQQFSQLNSQNPLPMISYTQLPYHGPASGNYVNYYETLLSENRTQNSEIRMHLCRLMDKIDHLAQQKQESSSSDIAEFKINFNKLLGQSSHQTKQLANLLDRVNTIGCSNNPVSEKRETVVKKEAPDESLVTELDFSKEANRKLKEGNDHLLTLLHEKTENLQAALGEIERLKQENLKLREEFDNNLSEQTENLKIKYEEENKKILLLYTQSKNENEKLVEQQKEMADQKFKDFEKLRDLRMELEEKHRSLDMSLQQNLGLEKALGEAKTRLAALEEELNQTKVDNPNRVVQSNAQSNVNELVKRIMNKVYKEITKQFLPDESYSLKNIKATVGSTIKSITLLMLNEGETTFNTDARVIPTPLVHNRYASNEIELDNHEEKVPINDNAQSHRNKIAVLIDQNVVDHDQQKDSMKEKLKSDEKAPVLPSLPSAKVDESVEEAHVTCSNKEDGSEKKYDTFQPALQSSLTAASAVYRQEEPLWKPDPPPLPPLADFQDEDDWLV